MENNNRGVLQEIRNNEANVPEGIGVAEDSGFASIAGSIAENSIKDEQNETLIAQDIKFRTINVEEIAAANNRKRKLVDTAAVEAKKKAEETYNQKKQEQVYKRLMHLLKKSKFYSSYIVDKFNAPNDEAGKKKNKGGKKKKETAEKNENVSPARRPQRNRKQNNKYNGNEYVSPTVKKRLDQEKKKMNLSAEEIEAELNSQSDSEEPTSKFVTPTYFTGTLRDYQKEGLKWLKLLYENAVNGILADEMGLGKTIQVIALFCDLLEKRQNGPYLIVAPLSTIPNWIMEFEKFAPNLKVFVLHGSPEAREAAKKQIRRQHSITDTYSTYPIVLTTYEVPARERTFLNKFEWRYIVIDEGQRIKNYQCQLVGVLNSLKSMNRLLLTGTPLQNDLSELWSLLNFLLPEIFDDLAVFESWFDAKELQEQDGTQKVLKQEEERHVLSTLREILKPFMLRREKSDVCLDIPPKKEILVHAPLTELQYELYAAVLNYDLETLSRIKNESEVLPDGPDKPKRRCTYRNKFSENYADPYSTLNNNASHSKTPEFDDNGEDSNDGCRENYKTSITLGNKTQTEKDLEIWRNYATINERNSEFFIRIRLSNRTCIYKQIVNHPYLLHCPLDGDGLPEISENMVKTSGKLLVLDAMLKRLKEGGHKVLLFSTMTMILDLIADYLNLRPWRYMMLDGRRDLDNRQESIKAFNEDPDIFLFLISTRAGGVGLNLAAADTVIIYDSDWNPQCDIQAMARCHRIGQVRPVVVYRLCTKGTVDERIISRAQAKRKLEKMVMAKDHELNLKNKETLVDLKRLLDATESSVVTAEKEVYTEAELDKILDRSDLIWPPVKNESTEE